MTPPRRSRRRSIAIAAVAGAVLVGAIAWQVADDPAPAKPAGARGRDAGVRAPGVMRRVDGQWRRVDPRDPAVGWAASAPAGMVRVEGRVYDLDGAQPVAGVEVVFSGPEGENATSTGTDGQYRVDVTPGAYRTFVRGDGVISIGPRVDDRLPGGPQAGIAGVPDDQIAPMVTVVEDQRGVDIPVVRGGTVSGRVTSAAGDPVSGAVVRALGGPVRPVLGTDFAETGSDGRFQLELPVGHYGIEAAHPGFAGVTGGSRGIDIAAGKDTAADITLALGCIITGKVVRASGGPSGDGAIERRFGASDENFSPAGKVEADGKFRWATLDSDTIALRAWPWKSPPSEAREFRCRDGERFDDVVFTIPNDEADIAGTVVDAEGKPVRFAFLDVTALEPGGINQQERADGEGKWGVYAMPAGRYRFDVFDPDGGVTSQVVEAPAHNVKLVLGGVGALAGNVSGIDTGSFTLELGGCDDGPGRQDRVRRQVIVPVRAGSYRVERLPACAQHVTVRAPAKTVEDGITIVAGQVARLDLDLAPRKRKVVTGVVSDTNGRPVANAQVSAAYGDEPARTTTDAQGRFRIETFAGEGIYAYVGERRAFALVGDADVPEERVDLQLADEPDEE